MSLWKLFKTWNTSGKEFASARVAAAYIARTIYFIYSSSQRCVCLFIQVVTNSCNYSGHQRFMRNLFKNAVTKMRSLAAIDRHGSRNYSFQRGVNQRRISRSPHTQLGITLSHSQESKIQSCCHGGAFVGLPPPNKTSTAQTEIWNTRNQWSFYQSVFFSVTYRQSSSCRCYLE